MISERRRRAVVSLKVECLSSREVGPFPSFIEKASAIVRETVGSHQLPADPVISGSLAAHRKMDVSVRLSE